MAPGKLSSGEATKALNSGLYLSNLHYLNWSDRDGGRITGMTRYACFWVEDGEIVAPMENMRFDDGIYNIFGSGLEAVTRDVEFQPDVDTYGGRKPGGIRVPGAIVGEFALTL